MLWRRGPPARRLRKEARAFSTKYLRFRTGSQEVFRDSDANPRAWAYASRLLAAHEAAGNDPGEKTLAAGLAGVLGVRWGTAFLAYLHSPCKPIPPATIDADYASVRATLLGWVKQRRLDLIDSTLDAFLRHVDAQHAQLVADPARKANAEAFLADLPPDLRLQASDRVRQQGYQIKVRVKGGGR